MIETAQDAAAATERELAPHVFLKQTPEEGQFVEIVMPPFELNDLITQCEQSFPQYAIQVIDTLARRDRTAITHETDLTPERIKGLFDTHLLGTVLVRQHILGVEAVPILTELQQAFGLVMQGRLRLTADPIPKT